MDVTQMITDAGTAFASISFDISIPAILRVLFTVLVCVVAVKVLGSVIAKMLGKGHLDGALQGHSRS